MYFPSRDGRVPVESRIVKLITDFSGDGGMANVSRAMAGPGKSVEFILSRLN
jgi:hypothetical protein